MSDGLYVSMSGAAARMAQLDAVSDNLANAQTPGFKAARPAFEAFLPAGGARDQAFAAAVATRFDLSPGPTAPTGNPLDVVPANGAFLAVRTAGGEVAYTRDGRLQLSGDGQLVTSTGSPVLDSGLSEIRLPTGAMPEIAPDGKIRSRGAIVGQLGIFQLSGAVDRVGPAQLAPQAGGSAEPVDGGRVNTGEIELGNSGPLQGMVELISAQRHFDASMQALQTYRRMDERSTDLGRVR